MNRNASSTDEKYKIAAAAAWRSKSKMQNRGTPHHEYAHESPPGLGGSEVINPGAGDSGAPQIRTFGAKNSNGARIRRSNIAVV